MKVLDNNLNYAQKLSIKDMVRSVSCFVCIEIIVFTLFALNWCKMLVIISFERILKFLVEHSSSDEMKMFYTEHDFQVDLEKLRVQLEISCRENTTIIQLT